MGRGRDEDGGDEGDEARSTFQRGREPSYGRLAAKEPNGGSLLRRLTSPDSAAERCVELGVQREARGCLSSGRRSAHC